MKLRKITFELPVLFLPDVKLPELKIVNQFWNGDKKQNGKEKKKR